MSWPYIAGFFDGEGTLGLQHRGHRSYFRVGFYQNALDDQVLVEIQKFLAGHGLSARIGRVEGRRAKGEAHLSVFPQNDVKFLLRKIEPFVIEKFQSVASALGAWGYEPTYQREMRWSYVAGFFDGEGSISVRAHANGKPNSRAQVKIYQCGVARVLDEISEFLTAKQIYNSVRRYANPPYSEKCFVEVNRQRAILKLLERMQPYMIVKTEQAADTIDEIRFKIEQARLGQLHFNSARAYV
jgi:hypothetical protein